MQLSPLGHKLFFLLKKFFTPGEKKKKITKEKKCIKRADLYEKLTVK